MSKEASIHKILLKKLAKHCVGSVMAYLESRPVLRLRLIGIARKMGIVNRLRKFNEHLPSSTACDVLPLRLQLMTSYPLWSAQFDTPDATSLRRLEDHPHVDSRVFIIARFDAVSQHYAAAFAVRLVASIGQSWQALFIFDPHCDAEKSMQAVADASVGDRRISYYQHQVQPEEDLQECLQVGAGAECSILIQGGALPRAHALRIFADALRDAPDSLMAYSDEDELSEGQPARNPWFKPGFSALLASQGVLLGRMLAIRCDAPEAQSVIAQFAAANVPAAVVRNYAMELGFNRTLHIPHVLFHDALADSQQVTVSWPLPETLPVVTIVIPTRDRWDLLGPCLESIRATDWPEGGIEILVVDNGSTDAKTLKKMAEAEASGYIRVIRDTMSFNWSRLNNVAARESRGALLVFLNNDTEVLDPAWLKKMATHALRPEIGAVGCKLLYPDRTVQHGGVIAGIQGVAGHAHVFLSANDGGYHNLANITHEVTAVTGACLAVTRENFALVGGFDENFRVAFNDIVFCFSLHLLGKQNIYVADALLIHHESKSRGYDDTPEKVALLRSEARKAWARYPQLMRDDPFYSPNLSLLQAYDLSFAPRRRAFWDDAAARPRRVLLLSATHAKGDSVAIVADLQAKALLKSGYEVIVGGPRSDNDYLYAGCERVEVQDPLSAATLAAIRAVDLIIASTPPFFSVTRWTGAYPPVLAYDQGDPDPDWFSDAPRRGAVLAEKDLALLMATSVMATSEGGDDATNTLHAIFPVGNSHLRQWNEAAVTRRQRVRTERGWTTQHVILNVCGLQVEERVCHGVDMYADVRDAMTVANAEFSNNSIFVLSGKATPKDVRELTRRGLTVVANATEDEVFDLYCAADAYANFSRWEGYNQGIGQALAMSLPVIASDIPAHRAWGAVVVDNADSGAQELFLALVAANGRLPTIVSGDASLTQFSDEVRLLCDGFQRNFPLCSNALDVPNISQG
ncbi:glycosyltransferase [Herbaspirillum sp. RTI4]|uniref:glycosyltransferase n=1 Tax=Herbaspirillum sp. RTI4 TaxID=3048640 RepID=UPI002AB4BA9A|nr:glycosyltransferase [Herbaspirillum sp. RTI4]MDY7577623.1 glycosyltransferase [Herbaspirillum sp. RTI4]MEA9982211.1 glycosyltransferase [Herbaspirillum sp. RTI4]